MHKKLLGTQTTFMRADILHKTEMGGSHRDALGLCGFLELLLQLFYSAVTSEQRKIQYTYH
jgi:hypothetical protein